MTDLDEPFERTTHPDAQWFPQAKMGLFMHWGIHSVAGIQPSWAMIRNYPAAGTADYPPERYFALARQFNPDRYDPDKYLAAARHAGFRYAVLTAKHHDGYALWPSRYGDFGTRQHLGGRDLIAPFVQACRRNGLKVGLYFSFADWHWADYPIFDVDFDFTKRRQFPPVAPQEDQRRFEEFYAYTRGQMEELLTGYGQIDLLWFDGVAWKTRTPAQLRTGETLRWIRSLQPAIVVNDRWGGMGDYQTPECQLPAAPPAGWWESCLCTNGHWGYNRDVPLPSAAWMLNLVHKCNRWGGNCLLNIGPRPNGDMPDDFYIRCDELAALQEA